MAPARTSSAQKERTSFALENAAPAHIPRIAFPRDSDASAAFFTLFESSREALLIIDSTGFVQAANLCARELLGLSHGNLAGRALADLVPAAALEQLKLPPAEAEFLANSRDLRALPRPAIHAGTPAGIGARIDAATHARIDPGIQSGMNLGIDLGIDAQTPIRVILRSILPGSQYLLLVIPPVSAAAPSEQLARAELQAVLDSLQSGILLLDLTGRLRFSNLQFGRLLGISPRKLAEIHTWDSLNRLLAGRLRRPPVFSARWKAFLNGHEESSRDEFELLRPSSRLLDRLSRPVLGSHGRPLGWLEIYTDVTERRKIHSHMLQTEKMAALGQVVSGIAHELNNPLTAIMGYVQLLLGHGLASGPLAEARRAYQEAERARRIVKNLLYFARENKPQRSAADLNEIIERTLALRSYELKIENILVQTHFDPHLPKTMADPYQLQQVVLNLLMNSEQALLEARGRGSVHIRTRHLDLNSHSRILFELYDDGPGIPREIVSRIFDPFFTTKGPGVGTGLGLSIVYGIVRQHDGEVTFQNQPGSGAKFTIELPVVPVPAGCRAEKPPRPALSSAVKPARILVVEDEPTVAQLVVDVLQEERHRVEAVLDAREGLNLLSRRVYHLVICDLRMPRLDGRAFFRSLVRARNPMRRRILFITGDTLTPSTLQFLRLNRLPYLAKPFLVEELKLAVRQQLEIHRRRNKPPARVRAETSRGRVSKSID